MFVLGREKLPGDDAGQKAINDEVIPFQGIADNGGDYLPAICLLENGQTAQFDLTEAEAEIKVGNYSVARAIIELQYQLGNLDAGYRLADLYAQGLGGRPEPARAFAPTSCA